MKLLLVAIHIEDSPKALPLGPAMLASSISKHFGKRIETQILDFYLSQSSEECCRYIMEQNATHIGFSMYVWNHDKTIEIAGMLKRHAPDTVIFLGGPEATANRSLSDEDCIDFIIEGEAEDSILTTLETLLSDRNGSQIKGNVQSAFPCLEHLSSPFLDGTLDPSGYSGLLWELSRGCPFKCDFCFESRGTSGVRRFPFERIENELELFKHNGVRQIFVLDPTFNYKPEIAKRTLRMLIEKDAGIHYSLEIRAEFLDREMAELFAALPCSLQIGLQSADPAVLKNVNRRLDPESFRDKILLLHEAEVTYGFDLIYGLPGDTLQGFLASLDFAMEMAPNHLDIFPLSVLPGTKLAETAATFGVEHLKTNPYTVISTPQFAKRDLARAAQTAKACDLFYNTGKAVPWFWIITSCLDIPASDFFVSFAFWMEENGKQKQDIIELQKDFLVHIFQKHEKTIGSGLIAADIVSYFGHCASLLEGERNATPLLTGSRYALNPESRFAHFNYDPGETMGYIFDGNSDLEELAMLLQEDSQVVFMHLNDGEIEMQQFSAEEQSLLEKMSSGIVELPDDETFGEFLAYCLSSNIIIAL